MALEDRFVDGCEIPGGTKYYILFTWYYIDEPHLHIGSEPSEIIGQVIYITIKNNRIKWDIFGDFETLWPYLPKKSAVKIKHLFSANVGCKMSS